MRAKNHPVCLLFKVRGPHKGWDGSVTPRKGRSRVCFREGVCQVLCTDIYLTGAAPSGATATVSYEKAGLKSCVSYSGAEFNVKIAHHTREQACPGKDCWLCPHYALRLPHPRSVLVVDAWQAPRLGATSLPSPTFT